MGSDDVLPTAEGDAVLDPEEAQAAGAPVQAQIAAGTSMGPVHLTVADLERSLAYYRDAVGLERLAEEAGSASLGTGERELLVLTEEPGARPARRHTGLYHFALLVPHRRDLAAWLAHAARDRVALAGLSDHYVSEAAYLTDPDGHGIEIYADRPREVWEGEVAERLTTLPLDVEALFAELPDPASEPFQGLPAATRMGHVHFKVSDIPEAIGFYRDVLGFGLMAQVGMSAAFLSAGGYHHHVGANIWESAGASPAPAGVATLRHATVLVPDEGELRAVLARAAAAGVACEERGDGAMIRDPSGNGLLFSTAAA